MPASDLVEGTSEIRNWIVTAAAADRHGHLVDYFPLYRTTTGVGCAMGFAYWDFVIDRFRAHLFSDCLRGQQIRPATVILRLGRE